MSRRSRKTRSTYRTANEPARSPAVTRYPVWDAHLRASHSLITLLFSGLFVSGHFGLGPGWLHLWLGYALLVVLLFRLGWGVIGSDSARFSQLMPSPRALIDYLPKLFSRQPSLWPGHNPVGALSTVILLTGLLLMSTTGLFVETWGEWRGPLADRIGGSTQLLMNDLHDLLRWPLLALVVLHLVAVFAYWIFKGEDRVRPIFRGGKVILKAEPELSFRGGARAWFLWIACAALVASLVFLGPVD